MAIFGINTPKTSALSIIEQSPYTFYLGGSRRMAEITCKAFEEGELARSYVVIPNDGTDYDFYATHTYPLEYFLAQNGFVTTSEAAAYYMDDEAVRILQRDNVQVVLRKDAELYKIVFDNIPPEFYVKRLWKSSPIAGGIDRSQIQAVFNMLFAVARAARGDIYIADSDNDSPF